MWQKLNRQNPWSYKRARGGGGGSRALDPPTRLKTRVSPHPFLPPPPTLPRKNQVLSPHQK